MHLKKKDKRYYKLLEDEVYVKNETIDYKYNEDNILKELQKYIDNTYSQHYSHKNFQATEFVIDSGHGEGFCIGNIMKQKD